MGNKEQRKKQRKVESDRERMVKKWKRRATEEKRQREKREESLGERLLHDPDLNAILPTQLQQRKQFYKFDKQLFLRNSTFIALHPLSGLNRFVNCSPKTTIRLENMISYYSSRAETMPAEVV